MKRQFRCAAFATGSVDLSRDTMALVMVVARAPAYLESVAVGMVTVDGMDATDRMIELLRRVPQNSQVRLLLTNATTMAGFNVIDTERLHRETGAGFVSIVREEPDADAVREALIARFDGWEDRWTLLSRHEWLRMGDIHVTWEGMDGREVADALRLTTVHGSVPEPLRIARLVATAIEDGVSHGRVV
ncbi:MAG TPA: DUF99 family protein [Thermoplasmata archaeon]|nr:DUF99 family protein [Thermoplasmata archaeon]